MQDPARALQETLDHEIPLSRALGIVVVEFGEGGLTLAAPLAPNLNHKATAFAGSLNAVATLAGWGLTWLVLREHGLRATVVIQESSVEYRAPVRGDFTAHCPLPAAAAREQLAAALARRSRARWTLGVEIRDGDAGRVAVTFTGRYVALGGDTGTR